MNIKPMISVLPISPLLSQATNLAGRTEREDGRPRRGALKARRARLVQIVDEHLHTHQPAEEIIGRKQGAEAPYGHNRRVFHEG
jgi:hypothetical protein